MTAFLLSLLIQAAGTPAPTPIAYRGNLTLEIEIQPPAGTAAVATNGDLVVTSLATYHAKLSTRTDRATRSRQCVLRRGFGLPAIDAGLCGSLLGCMATSPTRALVKACMLGRLTTELQRHYGVSPP
ncbi:hypothetical protein SAMN06297144_2063 [Sphingomonas guangdongensis]|uniref:Uncharacterized protein n=1 Tax=Sphingomonas guangdongensis TaxID=1141890 RepID=A0A285QZD8_9SPHN|nr:hypothetical protein [Sphingomonas guangdongensis]SOB86944.1 hypothetical protein SAMN06297144_2063 [Sphingomonas guangdongensis]